jgi:non-heme chloroperoxidase
MLTLSSYRKERNTNVGVRFLLGRLLLLFDVLERGQVNAGKRLPLTPEPMHHWERDGDVTIAGDSWGDPDGPLVVFLHGGGQTRHAWKTTGESLGLEGYHTVAFDARGHGDSDWAADGLYTQDARVGDLVNVLDALGQQDPILVGASMGGATCLIAVGEKHVSASALVLVDVTPRVEPVGVEKIRAFMDQKPDGFDSLEEVAEAIATYQPHRQRPKMLDGLAKNVRLSDDGKYHWHWDPRTRSQNINLQDRQDRLEECARSLRLPTLLIRGGRSDVISEEGAQSFLSLCPQSEYVNVTDAAHMVAGDRNDIFDTAIVSFLVRYSPISDPHR